MTDHVVLICTTCQGAEAALSIAEALRERLPEGYGTRMIECMAGCDHPLTVGFQAGAKAQYLFGEIQTSADIDALAAFARQYQNSSTGWTKATDRPEALLHKTLSRMPPLATGAT
ncbi:DUF1636 family protein [Ruegeria lacuscaerulensis]|uniref:DUF1636 family protein n=1 Tax=Ruegeria lacuscaerulensis TaxID=55218 RepID=UPI00147B428B|nr:DUF1636 family protein [Ruegeria lacuscaerulensis]